jgi:hypothetical protein
MNRHIKTDKIKKQTTYWLWFGRVSPLLFLIGSFSLFEIFNTQIPFIFYSSWIIFVTISLIWWAWVLRTILEFIKFFQEVSHSVEDIKDNIIEVQQSITILKDLESNINKKIDNPK